jgi:hypothetical protein
MIQFQQHQQHIITKLKATTTVNRYVSHSNHNNESLFMQRIRNRSTIRLLQSSSVEVNVERETKEKNVVTIESSENQDIPSTIFHQSQLIHDNDHDEMHHPNKRVKIVLVTGFESFHREFYQQAAYELKDYIDLQVFSDSEIRLSKTIQEQQE